MKTPWGQRAPPQAEHKLCSKCPFFFLIKKCCSDLPLPQPYRLCGFFPTETHIQRREYSPASYLSKMHSVSVSVGADLVQMSLELVWEIRVHLPSGCDLQAVTPAWSQPLVSVHHTDTEPSTAQESFPKPMYLMLLGTSSLKPRACPV